MSIYKQSLVLNVRDPKTSSPQSMPWSSFQANDIDLKKCWGELKKRDKIPQDEMIGETLKMK